MPKYEIGLCVSPTVSHKTELQSVPESLVAFTDLNTGFLTVSSKLYYFYLMTAPFLSTQHPKQYFYFYNLLLKFL